MFDRRVEETFVVLDKLVEMLTRMACRVEVSSSRHG